MRKLYSLVFACLIVMHLHAQQPAISSISPVKAAAGSTITIAGTGFNTTAANNIVRIGGMLATVTNATETALTVTVPNGATYGPVSVINTASSLSAASAQLFMPIFSPYKSTLAPTDFLQQSFITFNTSPQGGFLAADLTGDGKNELIAFDNHPSRNKMAIIPNTTSSVGGTISFGTGVQYSLTGITGHQSGGVGDLDGDGKLDIVAVCFNGDNNTGNKIIVMRNPGTGSLTGFTETAFDAFSNCTHAAIGDIDGDGRPDVVTANYSALQSWSIFRNTSTGTGNINFATRMDMGSIASSPITLTLADLDGDGKLDVIVPKASSSSIAVYLNTSTPGNISFATAQTFASTSAPSIITVGDLNADGKPDMVASYQTGTAFSVYTNTSTGTGNINFSAASNTSTGSTPYYAALGDLNGDGRLDLVLYGATNLGSNTYKLSVMNNNSTVGGSISFAPAVELFPSITAFPKYGWVADFNADGKPDILSVHANQARLAIFRNQLSCHWYSKPTGSANLNDASNWGAETDGSGQALPSFAASSYDNFHLSNAAGNNYGITSDWTVKGNLLVPAAATLNMGSNNILLGGNMANEGNITGSGYLSFNGTSAQSITQTGSYSNISINNNAGVNLTKDSGYILNLTGSLKMLSGTFTTNDSLVLKSTAAGTARIEAIAGGTLSGKVVTEHYIAGGRRAYRFLSHPFNASIGLNELTDNMDITGTSGVANGFTATLTNNPSAFWFNPSTGDASTVGSNPGWTAFTHTNGTGANAWKKGTGIRLLMRGGLGQGLDGNAYAPNAVTIDMKGTVNTGNQPISLTTAGYNLIGNPYPSPVDIGTLIGSTSNLGTIYWVWNANNASRGAYMPLVNGNAYSLDMHGVAIVQATAATTLNFTESWKTATATDNLLRNSNTKSGYLQLRVMQDGTEWDRLYIHFDNNAQSVHDSKDGIKLNNPDLNFYTLSSDKKQLSLDARPTDKANGAPIPLGLVTSYQYNYSIMVADYGLEDSIQVTLHDKLLNKYTPLSNGTAYHFSVTTDSFSQGEGRFELLQKTVQPTLSLNNAFTIKLYPNPASSNVQVTFSNEEKLSTSIILTNVLGQQVRLMNMGEVEQGQSNINLKGLPKGTYHITLNNGKQQRTEKLIVE